MGQKIFPVHLVVEQVETMVRLFLRFWVQLPRKHPDLQWCFQAHRQSPLLSFFKSTSEVRVLSSTGVTRLPRSYYPFRLPYWPSPYRECWRCDPRQRRISPNYSDHLPYMPCSLPRWTEHWHVCSLPCPRGHPQLLGRSASTTSLSRPAQASLALRPARLLARLRRDFVPRLQPSQLPD